MRIVLSHVSYDGVENSGVYAQPKAIYAQNVDWLLARYPYIGCTAPEASLTQGLANLMANMRKTRVRLAPCAFESSWSECQAGAYVSLTCIRRPTSDKPQLSCEETCFD